MSKSENKPPIFQKIIQPIIHLDIQPVITTEIQPIINKEIQPVIHKEFQSIIRMDIQPINITEIQPIIYKKIQPIVFKESQINNIEETIQQLYESNKPNEKEKLDDQPGEIEKKIIKEITESYNQYNNNTQKPKNKEKPKSNNSDKSSIKTEKSEMQRQPSIINEDKRKKITQKLIQPNIIMEEHHIRRLEIVPFFQRKTKVITQKQICPLVQRENTYGNNKIIEQKTEKKIKNIGKYEVVPFIKKNKGEIIPYEKKNISNNINNSIIMMENIIAVYFESYDYDIHYPIPCKKTDIFSKIENKLYQEYPNLKNKKIFFSRRRSCR